MSILYLLYNAYIMDLPPYTIKADNQIYTVQKSISQYPGRPTYEYLKIADGHRCLQYSYATDNSDEIELYWLHLAGQESADGEYISTHMEKLEKLFHISIQILKLNTQSTYIDFSIVLISIVCYQMEPSGQYI